jgi:cellobiose phosphorylase
MVISNPTGLSVGLLENGSIKAIEVEPVRIGLKPATIYSKFGANIFIRKRGGTIEYIPILGPESRSIFEIRKDAIIAKGEWKSIKYECTLCLSPKSNTWQWTIDTQNSSDSTEELDVIYLQDIGLKPAVETTINEYYVSQYLERLILYDKNYGSVVCCRQNMRGPTGNPWVMVACRNSAASASTDGMQFYGPAYRETGIPQALRSDSLDGEYAGESSVVALQEKPFVLAAKQKHTSIFAGTYLNDHPAATTTDDLQLLPILFNEFEGAESTEESVLNFAPEKNLFNVSPFLPVDDLTKTELEHFFGTGWRHCEEEAGTLLSFFCSQGSHVAPKAKELLVDRPHGHIMLAHAGLLPDEHIVSTTAYAHGVFNSHLAQGNTNFNIFLSVASSQFNLSPETGQRIFAEIDGQTYLLGVPSAFEMGLNFCRWIYKHNDYCIQVRTWTSCKAPQVNLDVKILSGNIARLLVTNHFDDSNGWEIASGHNSGEIVARPKPDSPIARRFPEALFKVQIHGYKTCHAVYDNNALCPSHRGNSGNILVIELQGNPHYCISIIGEVCKPVRTIKIDDADRQWLADYADARKVWLDLTGNLTLNGVNVDLQAIHEILPWFGMNALTHYLAPHGLEQFGGAAWGTRDVSQGPIDLLLSLGKYNAARQVLCTIFAHQDPDGGWPQWWMFDSYSDVRAHEAHGDISYWCIIALCNYIKITGDLSILNEVIPYHHERGYEYAEKTTLNEHVDRLLSMIVKSFIEGTALVPYGGGDWNDSLQPASRELAERMISSWTVEMSYQAFSQYQQVCELAGDKEKAEWLKTIATKIRDDFQRHLIKDGVVAGYGLVEQDGSFGVLLHPTDSKTKIHYSLLPMNRGIISGMFTKEQALAHQQIIDKHLKGPDGARLMDRPLKYRGGIQTIFQRAESSTFFGREIGLMYVHEHIRYAESQAILGNADEFVKALRQANPVAYREIVGCGDIRQANCYYSSSDVIFKNRYDADQNYSKAIAGEYSFRGGWRVYSSGPGIYIGLIVSRLLGIRTEFGKTIIDPVIPLAFDGLTANTDYMGFPLEITYFTKEGTYSPKAISVNGRTIDIHYESSKYRKGGAVIETRQFLAFLSRERNVLEIVL